MRRILWGVATAFCPIISITQMPTNCRLTDEFVTRAMHGQNETWFFRFGFDLLPQANDVSVYRASGWEAIVAPDFLQQTIAAQALALVANQIFQQLELFGRKLQRLARARDLAISKIDFHVAEGNALLLFWYGS